VRVSTLFARFDDHKRGRASSSRDSDLAKSREGASASTDPVVRVISLTYIVRRFAAKVVRIELCGATDDSRCPRAAFDPLEDRL